MGDCLSGTETQDRSLVGRSDLARIQSPDAPALPTLRELLTIPADEVPARAYDLAAINLVCAQGLRGADDLDVPAYLARLDYWARQVAVEAGARRERFERNPERFEHSLAFFRMMGVCYVLGKKHGVRYSAERAENPDVWDDSRDSFIHGVLGPTRYGTCASLPVAMVALGRRLGYPVRLIASPGHVFVRWQDDRERHNFDWNDKGLGTGTDDEYRHARNLWTDRVDLMEQCHPTYLLPFDAVRELAYCLATRAHCLAAVDRDDEALECYRAAARLLPDHWGYQLWHREQWMKVATPRPRTNHAPLPQMCLADGCYWNWLATGELSRPACSPAMFPTDFSLTCRGGANVALTPVSSLVNAYRPFEPPVALRPPVRVEFKKWVIDPNLDLWHTTVFAQRKEQ
jgi:hypothetical protein